MNSRHAQCTCGQLKVACNGDPVRVSICHCLACQRRTGSPFAQQARWPTANVKIEGAATTYVRIGDSGGTMTSRFCATCGATVYYEIDKMPGFIAVPVGVFADPAFPPPSVSIYEARKHGWVSVPEECEHLD